MEIERSLISNLNINNSTTAETVSEIKQLININNKIIVAEVLDLIGKNITLEMSDGQVLNGKLSELAIANIGDFKEFIVNTKDNTMIFDVLDKNSKSDINQFEKNLLKNQGLKPTDENVNAVSFLLKNNMTLTKENIKSFVTGTKIFGNNNAEEILFMLKNEIPMTEKNASTLIGYKEHKIKLSDNLNELDRFLKECDKPIKEELTKIISDAKKDLNIKELIKNNKIFENEITDNNNLKNQYKKIDTFEFLKFMDKNDISIGEAKDLLTNFDFKNRKELTEFLTFLKSDFKNESEKNILVNKFLNENFKDFDFNSSKKEKFFKLFDNITKNEFNKDVDLKDKFLVKNFESSEPKDIDKYFHLIKDVSKIVKQNELINTDFKGKEIVRIFSDFKNNIDFFGKIKDNVFFQIPIKFHDEIKEPEILILKDNNTKKISKDRSSAIISLDTTNLGIFETFVKKDFKSVSLEFRLESEDVINLVKENITELKELLKNSNYSLDYYNFKTSKESFSLILDNKKELQNIKAAQFDVKM